VMDISASWFHNSRGEVSESPRSAPTRTNAAAAAAAPRINSVVQWARNKFNDALEKSEFVSRKLVEAQKRLPLDHPGHPNNHPSTSMYSAGSVGTSTEHVLLTSGITAEKLMYDRALEMSRTAAVNELTQEDFEGGVLSYRTAIYMLEAILDNDEDRSTRRKSVAKRDEKPEDELINGLEFEDRATVQKLLEGLRLRLRTIKKKIEVQRGVKRSSITSVPQGYTPPVRNSPTATPQMSNTPPR